MNKPDTKETELRQEVAEEALNAAADQARQAERAAKAGLARLKTEYEQLLIDLALDRSSDVARKFEIRVEVRGLEAELEDLSLVWKGIETERVRTDSKLKRAGMLAKDAARYEALKDEITVKGLGLGPSTDLRMWAAKLDCLDDAESFLSALLSGEAA